MMGHPGGEKHTRYLIELAFQVDLILLTQAQANRRLP